MFRRLALSVADHDLVARTLTQNGLSQGFVLRFVAGETLDDAIQAIQRVSDRGLKATLDALGENVTSETEAATAAKDYTDILTRLDERGIDSHISVKLTMLGLDISDDLARQNMCLILDRARETGNFVRIDMEGSAYTQRTLDLFHELHAQYDDHVGIVLQSYLYRTDRDVRDAIERGARVRLVKGAYAEPPTVAYPAKREVDAAYRRHMEMLLDAGNYPALATHDEAIIEVAKGYTARMGIDTTRFEFQMLYGVRRDLQEQLVRDGYTVRIYVPFGPQWYPYFTRRIAERPANLLFVLRNLLRP